MIRMGNKWLSLIVLFAFLGCNRSNMDQRVDFTVDMTVYPYSNLQNTGGWCWYSDLVLIHDYLGNYYALSKYCTVDLTTLNYNPTPSYLYCTTDQTQYSTTGAVLTPRSGASPLTSYHTSVNGNYLRVYSSL